MDIRQPCSFGRLFFEGFSLVNKTFGTLFILFVCMIVGILVLGVLTVLCKLPPLFVTGVTCIYTVFLTVMLMRLFASRAEKDNLSLPDIAIASVMPTIHLLILGILFFIALLVLTTPFRSAGDYPVIVRLLVALLTFFLALRFIFAPIAVAVRDQGPINALKYSWRMTGKHWIYTPLTMAVTIFFPIIVWLAILFGLYVGIPLYFADSFNLAQPSVAWLVLLLCLHLFHICIQLAMSAFLILVFLYLDYQDNRGRLPQQAMPEVQATPAVAQATPENADGLQVEASSFKTHAENEEVAQHLDKVYTPKEDVIEYTEEDRMPTILFDDEMAKQIEKDRLHWEQEKSRSKTQGDDADGPSSIKMSK